MRPLGLGSLLHGCGGEEGGTTLVQKMRALERGEIDVPAAEGLGGLVEALAPQRTMKPAAPQRLAYQDVLDEQAAADAVSRAEMRVVVGEKLRRAAERQDWAKAQKMAQINSELDNWR